MMNRIRDSTFILITVLAVIFIVGGYFLLEDKNRLIEATQKELKGIALQRESYALLIAAENLRGSTLLANAGDLQFTTIREQSTNNIAAAITAIDTLDPAGIILPQAQWADIKSFQPQDFSGHTLRIHKIIAMMRDVGDASTLILDPEMTSYYLMDIIINRIPSITEHIAYNRGITVQRLIAHTGANPETSAAILAQLLPLHESLVRAATIVQTTKRSTYTYGSNRQELDTILIFYTQLLEDAAQTPSPLTSQQFFERSGEVIHSYQNVFQASADLLTQHLNQRIRENKNGRIFTILFLLLMYCLVIYIGYLALRNYVHKQEVVAARNLTHLMAQLEKSNNELEHFAYIASHDLKEPLRTIASFAKLLQQKYANAFDATGQEYLAILMGASMRMQQMISDLLEYSRVDYELATPEAFDCAAEIKRVLENLKQPIEQSGASITYAGLPTIIHHPSQFARIMQNLISNAIKYRRENVAPQITITADEQEHVWRLSVQDNGIGIDQDYFLKIFEPFKRLHTQQQFEGTGIGLAICKKAVERMGGKLWVTSATDQGSTFYFTLLKLTPVKKFSPSDTAHS
jgi:signal transduction histidine kinase